MVGPILTGMRVFLLHILCAVWFVSPSWGDLRFQNPNQYPAGSKATGIFVADFDGDGFSDLAVASRESNMVTVLYNDGTGYYPTSAEFETGSHPRYVDGGDFDGDGDIDLCTPDYYGMTCTILENDGSGHFTMKDQYDFFTPAYVWVEDLDSDGILDIGMLHWDGEVKQPGSSDGIFAPMFGLGDGTFEVGEATWVGEQPRGGDAADLNGDGLIDIVSADIKSMTISILLGTTSRTWENSVSIALSPGTPRYVSLGDFDGDGDEDIACLDKLGGQCWLLYNDGDANFTLEDTIQVNDSPHSMVVVDIDKDNDLDYVISHVGSITQLILFNDGTGHVESTQGVFIPGGAAEIKTADLNNDGMLDITTANVNVSHPGAAVLIQRDCLTCDSGLRFIGDADCPPISEDIELSTDSFTMVDIIGESFSGNTLDFVITTLPEHGELRELNGLIVSSIPYFLSSNSIQYFPENGHLGIEVFNYSVNDCLPSNESQVQLQIDYPFPDECNIAFEVFNGASEISTLSATNSPESYDANQCNNTNFGALQNDIWLRYVACNTGELQIDTCSILGFDSDVVVYDGDCCNLNQLACNGDGVACEGGGSAITVPVEIGNTYLIRIGGSTESSVGSGTILLNGPVGICIESCFTDLQVDGEINVGDLLVVIGQWGNTCGAADLNVDGEVDVMDLLLVIGAWGPCEG
jgi:hypothetical protein